MARYFEFIGEDSQRKSEKAAKFWEISLDGSTVKTRFGRIGANGQTTVKDFPSEEAGRAGELKMISEKVKKGYVEKVESVFGKPEDPLASAGENEIQILDSKFCPECGTRRDGPLARFCAECGTQFSQASSTSEVHVATTFTNRCTILGDFWIRFKSDDEYSEFCAYNDLGLPLAYVLAEEISLETPKARVLVNETFELLLVLLETGDVGYESLFDLIEL
jgi:predicted DNA-binding WGR domain protein